MAQVRQPAEGRSISRLEARLASDQRHAQLRLCGRSGAAGASFDGGRGQFALPIGFLHSDKHGRNSLVWDAIEPLRPLIDALVFKFIAQREFTRSDFPQAGRNAHRIGSRDHRRASAGFAVAVATARGRGAMDGEDDCRRRQTTSKGLNTRVPFDFRDLGRLSPRPRQSPVASRKSKGSGERQFKKVTCNAPRPRYSRRHRPDLWGRSSRRLGRRRARDREREISDVDSGEIE